MTDRQKIEKLKKYMSKSNKIITETQEQIDRINENKRMWMVYWRLNPSLYIHYKMGITLFGYQHIRQHMMSQAQTYFDVSTRGTAKSFDGNAYGLYKCLTHPFSQVVLLASTRDQATDGYREKFIKEFVNKEKMSPFISYLYKHGLITTKEIDKGYLIEFWNGSTFTYAPCIPSTRGLRATVLILEECRLMKKADVDSIGIPMLIPRQPEFKNLTKYKSDRSYDEPEQTIYITSNRFKSEWFNTLFNKTVVGYFKDNLNEHRVMCIDIFTSIKNGLKTPQWYFGQKESMDELSFNMEVLNLTAGEADGAYFSWDMFRKNQTIKTAFYPSTLPNLPVKLKPFPPKKENEYRVIFVDFSWVGDYKGQKNDGTVIGCGRLNLKDDTLYRSIDYISTYSGSEAGNIAMKVKEAFWAYKADYVVLDMRSAGEMLFIDLSKPMDNPYLSSSEWNSHGFTICGDEDLHFVKPARLEEITKKVVDVDAIPCIIPVTASTELNSNMWIDLARRLKSGEIQLLIDDLEYVSSVDGTSEWMCYTSEEKAVLQMPYMETLLLINEAVNLTQKWTSGQLKLSEPLNGTKDSIVAVAYFNLFASKLLNKLDREKQDETEIDWSKMQCVF